MLFHPAVRALVGRPDLVAEHASAYAELAAAEGAQAVQLWRGRAASGIAALVLALTAAGLSGGAALLACVIPLQAMPAPWGLVLIPGLTWAAAGLCLWLARRSSDARLFGRLREQWSIDRAWIAKLGDPT